MCHIMRFCDSAVRSYPRYQRARSLFLLRPHASLFEVTKHSEASAHLTTFPPTPRIVFYLFFFSMLRIQRCCTQKKKNTLFSLFLFFLSNITTPHNPVERSFFSFYMLRSMRCLHVINNPSPFFRCMCVCFFFSLFFSLWHVCQIFPFENALHFSVHCHERGFVFQANFFFFCPKRVCSSPPFACFHGDGMCFVPYRL